MSDAPTPSLTGALIREHRAISRLLDVLDALGRLADAGEAPVDACEQALEFIRTYADALHHGKEEQLLFPAMEAAGLPTGTGPIAVMCDEHEQARDALVTMERALDAMGPGERAAGEAFARAAGAYTHLLREHIRTEDEVVFPMVEELLGPGEKADLADAFARLEEDDIGRETCDRMLRLVDELSDMVRAKS